MRLDLWHSMSIIASSLPCVVLPLKAEHTDDESKAARYSIPYGFLFRFVSMPHYLCEMIEYTGLWMFSGFKMSQG